MNDSTVYHIHEEPVPKDGNCTDTEAHLDPFQRGEVPACDPDLPQTCQVGDLAGKHGAIVTTSGDTTFETTYTDDFTAVSDYSTCLKFQAIYFIFPCFKSPLLARNMDVFIPRLMPVVLYPLPFKAGTVVQDTRADFPITTDRSWAVLHRQFECGFTLRQPH